MDDDDQHVIRDTLNHELVLGRSLFTDRIEAMTCRQTALGAPVRPRIEEKAGLYLITYMQLF